MPLKKHKFDLILPQNNVSKQFNLIKFQELRAF